MTLVSNSTSLKLTGTKQMKK